MANILRLASRFGRYAGRAVRGVVKATPKIRIKGNPPRKPQGEAFRNFKAPKNQKFPERGYRPPQGMFDNKKGIGPEYRHPSEGGLYEEQLLEADYKTINEMMKYENQPNSSWRFLPTENEMKMVSERGEAESWLMGNSEKMTARGNLLKKNAGNSYLARALEEADAVESKGYATNPSNYRNVYTAGVDRRLSVMEEYGRTMTREAEAAAADLQLDKDFMRSIYEQWEVGLDGDIKNFVYDIREIQNEGMPLRTRVTNAAKDFGARISRGINRLRNPSIKTGEWDDPLPGEWFDESKGITNDAYWARVSRGERDILTRFKDAASEYSSHISTSTERLRSSLATYVFNRGVSGGRMVGTAREMQGIRRVISRIEDPQQLIRYVYRRLGRKVAWAGFGWGAGQGLSAIKDWILSESEKDVDVPSSRGNNPGPQNTIKNAQDNWYGGSELTQPPDRESGAVSSSGLAPEEGGGIEAFSRGHIRNPMMDMGYGDLRGEKGLIGEETAKEKALRALRDTSSSGSLELGKHLVTGKEPDTRAGKVAVGAVYGGLSLLGGDPQGVKNAGELMLDDEGNNQWERKEGIEDIEPGDDFQEFHDLDMDDLDARIDAIADAQAGGDPGGLNYRNGRKGHLKGSVLNAPAPFAPLGRGDNNAVKSSPIFGDNALDDTEMAYRNSLGFKTPMYGTDISEKLNDPRGRKLQTSIPTDPTVESADQFHPNHYYEPAVDPKTGVMKLILRKRERDDALSEFTYSTSDKRLRTGTRDAELLVPLTYDTRYMPSLPAGVDIFTLADGAPKPYMPTQPRMGPQLYDAPELVGVGWDERNPPPDPRTMTMSTSSTVSTSGAQMDFTRKGMNSDNNRPDLSKESKIPAATESSVMMRHPGTTTPEEPSRLARRPRDSYNAANQTNPFSVNIPKAPMPSEPIPAYIGKGAGAM